MAKVIVRVTPVMEELVQSILPGFEERAAAGMQVIIRNSAVKVDNKQGIRLQSGGLPKPGRGAAEAP